jgi:hypothetical protein
MIRRVSINARYLAAVVALLSAGSARADASAIDGVYWGTLGKQDIVLEIGPIESPVAEDHYDGRYFYRRHGVAIPLKMEPLADGRLRVLEYDDGAPSGAEWLLAVAGDTASGEFCSCDLRVPAASAGAKRAAIALALVAGTRNQPHDKAYGAQLLDFPLSAGPEIRVADGIAYVIQTDPRFGVSLPRLMQFPDAAVMSKVNDGLAKALDERRLWVADCYFQGQLFSDTYWEEQYRVALLNRDVLSIGGWASVACGGGAHPADMVATFIYDLHTGKAFDFAASPQTFFRASEPPWDALRSLYVKYARRSDTMSDCWPAPADEEEEAMIEFDVAGRMYFDAKGLAIDPRDSVPHAIAACFTEVVIPYREIRKFVRPDSPFYRLMQ